nr:MAG TPA: hypothetical protein [Caudoviricetes sp.]
MSDKNYKMRRRKSDGKTTNFKYLSSSRSGITFCFV